VADNNKLMGERMVKLETEMKNVVKGMDENKEAHRLLFSKIDEFINAADKKYVTKQMLTFALSVLTVIFVILTFVFATKGG